MQKSKAGAYDAVASKVILQSPNIKNNVENLYIFLNIV